MLFQHGPAWGSFPGATAESSAMLGADAMCECWWCCRLLSYHRSPAPTASETITVPSTSLDAWEEWAPKDLEPTDLLLLKVGRPQATLCRAHVGR